MTDIALVEGSKHNIKITTPIDMRLAEAIITDKNK
jgi:2-C-methyl-D-erythritol 4-phosphate cytidylyltransferase